MSTHNHRRTPAIALAACLALASAPSHAADASTTEALKRARTRALLLNDAQFFDEAVRRMTEDQHQSVFNSAKAPPSSEGSKAGQKAAEDALRGQQRRLNDLPTADFEKLVDLAEPLFAARQIECARKLPVIHTIGWSPTFTFESSQAPRPANAGERAVRIPVEGYDLDPPCIAIDVTIEGTVPVSRYGASKSGAGGAARDFYLTLPSEDQKDGLNIILLEPFIDRLHTGDKVAIKVTAANKFALPETAEAGSSAAFRRKSIARRVFVAYETEAFRTQVLRSRIRPDDINAFPLPENDIAALFGPLIAKNYFVVRVSVRNTESDAKIISTGMIRASGTAMIDPKVPGPSFSVPVSIVPHSLTQIYSVLTDEEVDQPRHRTFRALEFIGALAAGAQGVFNYGAQAAKNVALFTGIVVPEAKKLWPDRWPGYQRNIVTYAMQDLVKVPANSVMDHKFLFFSKKELDGLVSDPNLFKSMSPSEQLLDMVTTGDRRSRAKPEAFVIALAFDTLDIRFETMPVALDLTSRDVLRDLVGQVADQGRDLDLSAGWLTTQPAIDSLKFASYSVADSRKLTPALAAIAAVNAGADADLGKAVQNAKLLQGLAQGLEPATNTSALATDLYATSAKYGQASVAKARLRIAELNQRVNGGADAEIAKDEIHALKNTVTGSRDLLAFYKAVAAALHDLAGTIDKVKLAATATPPSKDQKRQVQDFNASVEAMLVDLAAKRPPQASLQVKPAP
jgi:hypothetical protein